MQRSHLVEKKYRPIFHPRWSLVLQLLKMFRQIANIDEVRIGGEDSGEDCIFEFTDISLPVMMLDRDLSSPRQAMYFLLVSGSIFLEEVTYEDWNILWPLIKSGQPNMEVADLFE